MSGVEDVRDIPVVVEELVAPTQPAPEPVPVVQIDDDSNIDQDIDEDPEEEPFEEEPIEEPVEEEPIEEQVEEAQELDGDDINPEIQEAFVQMGTLVHHLMNRNVELNMQLYTAENKAQFYEEKTQQLQVQNQEVNDLWNNEVLLRYSAEQQVQEMQIDNHNLYNAWNDEIQNR